MKPPILFHSRDFQNQLLAAGSREQIIEWLVWNDPNGTYVDAGSALEDLPPLTLERAREIMSAQVHRDDRIR